MKVTLLCVRDWANIACTLASCLRKVGVDAKAFSQYIHRFNYTQRAILFSEADVKKEVEDADVVVFVHSSFIETGVDLSKKVVAVIHAGSSYRQNHNKINKVFNPIVDITFCGSDLLGFGSKNEVCMQPAIDTEFFKPVYSDFTNRKNVIIAHYPTSPKGYGIIQEVIDKLKLIRKNIDFKYDSKTVPFEDHIKRVSECDIYIEDMHDNQKGVPLTAFGITTLECACLGKVVCTRFPDLPIYEKLFGKCMVQVTNDKKELEEKLKWLLTISDKDFIELQKSTRQWVEERHSFEVIGNWFKREFEKIKGEN